MNERMQQYRQWLVHWWKGSSTSQKLRAGVVLALFLAVAGVTWGMLTNPNYQPLYTNLNAAAAGQITAQLTQMKVPYQLSDQGRTVLVPRADVNQVRVTLADQNIPSSGTVGLPTPLTFSLGETDQELQLSQLVNIEASLQETINTINGIHNSRVLINEPSPSLFGESQTNATASVFVDLTPGDSLSTGQVRGIMNLVAHSVSGLAVNQVIVVDQSGNVLSAGLSSNSPAGQLSGMSSAEMADQNSVDNQISNNISSMLQQMLGPGAAVVRVNATLNFNQSTVDSTQYGKSTLSSQQVQTQKSSQTAATVTQTGTGGNVPVYPNGSAGGPSTSSSTTTVSHYLVDTTNTHQTIPAGNITRLTVAVVVNKTLSPAQANTIKNLVAAAAGITPAVASKVVVVGAPFNRAAVNSALLAMNKASRAEALRRYILLGLAVVAGVLLLLWIRRMAKRINFTPAFAPAGPSLPKGDERSQLTGDNPRLSVADLLNEMRLAKEPSQAEVAKKHLDQLVKSDPDSVARLIRAWMQEDDT
ncbi:MAG: flagellar basal-body MS-ring/collar protein FliF [Sulfobacillus sp.]